MLVLDSEVIIDLANGYPPAVSWFTNLGDAEQTVIPGAATAPFPTFHR